MENVIQESSIQEYSQTEAALAELRMMYMRDFDVSTNLGLADARKAVSVIRGYRTALEKKRVELKGPALARCRDIDSEAKRITKELLNIEEPIKKVIKEEEDRKEREKMEIERLESLRISEIRSKINQINYKLMTAISLDSASISLLIGELELLDISDSEYQEFVDEAIEVRNHVIFTLSRTYNDRVADEINQARVKAENEAEAERLRLEREVAQKEAERVKLERDAAIAEAAKLRREALEREQQSLVEKQRSTDSAVGCIAQIASTALPEESEKSHTKVSLPNFDGPVDNTKQKRETQVIIQADSIDKTHSDRGMDSSDNTIHPSDYELNEIKLKFNSGEIDIDQALLAAYHIGQSGAIIPW